MAPVEKRLSAVEAREPSTDTETPHGTAPPIDPALEIGGRLAAHRAQRGLKVSELARRVSVSPSLISQIERGQSRPSVSTLFAMAQALDVPVDAFFREHIPDGRSPRPVDTAASAALPAPSDAESRYVVHRGDRAAIDIEGGVRWERLTPT